MKTLFSRLITVIAWLFYLLCRMVLPVEYQPGTWLSALIWRCCYFRLAWRLGLMLQCPRGYWPVLLGAEWLLIYWLMPGGRFNPFLLIDDR